MRSYNALYGALQGIINALKYFYTSLYIKDKSKVWPIFKKKEYAFISSIYVMNV